MTRTRAVARPSVAHLWKSPQNPTKVIDLVRGRGVVSGHSHQFDAVAGNVTVSVSPNTPTAESRGAVVEKSSRLGFSVLAAFLSAVLSETPAAMAQEYRATLTGQVKDSQSGVLPGVTVTATHADTG